MPGGCAKAEGARLQALGQDSPIALGVDTAVPAPAAPASVTAGALVRFAQNHADEIARWP